MFLFTIIMPIYNTEEYLDEAVSSVINQSIGFEDNIQMILVNDGSTDSCEQICQKYVSLYPNNILYVHKENGGISSARNAGLNQEIRGRYVNFFDSDDIWEEHALERMFNFIQETGVKIAAGRMCLFGREEGFKHPLDYKFDRPKVLDFTEEWEYPQLHGSSTFFLYEIIRDRRFDETLITSEDIKFITESLFDVRYYGLLPDAVYMYRKRDNLSSTLDVCRTKEAWYFNSTRACYEELYELSERHYGRVIPYIQFITMYEIQWRLKTVIPPLFDEAARKEYIEIIKNLLSKIDDKYILAQRNIDYRFKMFALSLKYDRDIISELEYSRENRAYMYQGMKLVNFDSLWHVIVNVLELSGDEILLEGRLLLNIDGKLGRAAIKHNDSIVDIDRFTVKHKAITAFDGTRIYDGTAFRAKLRVKNGDKIKFVFVMNDGEVVRFRPTFQYMAKLNRSMVNTYYGSSKYLLTFKKNTISVRKTSAVDRVKAEIKYQKELREKGVRKIGLYRILALLLNKVSTKRIWLFTDRTNVAGDNGEALFKYVAANDKNVQSYFVVDEESPDYKRMKAYGKVLKYGSFQYKLAFLRAEKIISSQADDWVINAFGEEREYVKDLYNQKFCFLQHGITKDDISSWLWKLNKNIKLFVTASARERDSIIHGDYAYSEEVVQLTGFPRFDYLENRAEKRIAFAPTWRQELAGKSVAGSSERLYSNGFRLSDYYKFYNKLINDKRVLDVMERCGYKGDFYVHPLHSKQAMDFTGNDIIEVHTEPAVYKNVFAESALLVTDYSSVAFDFCYLKKPVIYAQFDKERFFSNHTYSEGYFKYKEDGFGPVTDDYESTVQAIVSYIENDCLMEAEYEKRVDSFFEYTDNCNCERVYRAIKEM